MLRRLPFCALERLAVGRREKKAIGQGATACFGEVATILSDIFLASTTFTKAKLVTSTSTASVAQVSNDAECRAVTVMSRATLPSTTSKTTMMTSKGDFPSTLTTSSLTKCLGTPVLLASPGAPSGTAIDRLSQLSIGAVCVVNNAGTISGGTRGMVRTSHPSTAVAQLTKDAHFSATCRVCDRLAGLKMGSRATVVSANTGFTSTLSISPCSCVRSTPFFLDSRSKLSRRSLTTLGSFRSTVVINNAGTIPSSMRRRLQSVNITASEVRKAAHCRADLRVDGFALRNLSVSPSDIMCTAKTGFPSTLSKDTLTNLGGAILLLTRGSSSPAVKTSSVLPGIRSICILNKRGTVKPTAFGTVTGDFKLDSERCIPRPAPGPRPGPSSPICNARGTNRFYGGSSLGGASRSTEGNGLVIYGMTDNSGGPH